METKNVILEENHLTKVLLKTVSTCCFCGTFQSAAKLGHRKRTATFKEAVEFQGSFSLWKTAVGAEDRNQALVQRKGGKV